MKSPNLDYGFQDYIPSGADEIHHENKTEVLGNVKKILFPDGDIRPYMSAGEMQKRNDKDKMDCVTRSSLRAIGATLNRLKVLVDNEEADEEQQEIIRICRHFRLFNEQGEYDVSERYIAKVSGTTERGNNYKNVADAIRHYGLLPEADYPYVNDYNEYYQTVPQNLIEAGKKVAEHLDFNYEFIEVGNFTDARFYGVPATSGYAWNGQNGDVYYRVSYYRNHAIPLVWQEIGAQHQIFDTYIPFLKKLAWDYNLGYGVLFTVHLKEKLSNQRETLLNEGYKYVIRADAHGEFYKLNSKKLDYIEEQSEIKKIIAEDFNYDINTDLIELTKQKKIKWITENEYKDLK